MNQLQRKIGCGFILVLLCVSWGGALDWSYWRGPEGTGVSAEKEWTHVWPTTGPKRLWEAQVGIGFSSIVVAQGKAYTMGHQDGQDQVSCLDALTGEVRWTHRYDEPKTANLYEGGPNATPTVVNGRVYTLSKTGKAGCFDAASGKVLWFRDLAKEHDLEKPEWGFSSSPLVLGDSVYLNMGAAGLAVSATDGSLQWASDKENAGYASLLRYGKVTPTTLLVLAGEAIQGVEAATGKIRWTQEWKTQYQINAGDPLVVQDKVFVSTGYGYGCGLLEIAGDRVTEVYRNKKMRNQCYGSVLYQEHVYGFDGHVGGKSSLVCMDPLTGTVKWEQKDEVMGTGTLFVAGDRLVILGEKGKLFIAKAQPSAYEELAAAQVLNDKCWTVPCLANGLFYARDAQGHLVCLDLRE